MRCSVGFRVSYSKDYIRICTLRQVDVLQFIVLFIQICLSISVLPEVLSNYFVQCVEMSIKLFCGNKSGHTSFVAYPYFLWNCNLDDKVPCHACCYCMQTSQEEEDLARFATQTRSNALDPAQLDPERARRIVANRQVRYFDSTLQSIPKHDAYRNMMQACDAVRTAHDRPCEHQDKAHVLCSP